MCQTFQIFSTRLIERLTSETDFKPTTDVESSLEARAMWINANVGMNWNITSPTGQITAAALQNAHGMKKFQIG